MTTYRYSITVTDEDGADVIREAGTCLGWSTERDYKPRSLGGGAPRPVGVPAIVLEMRIGLRRPTADPTPKPGEVPGPESDDTEALRARFRVTCWTVLRNHGGHPKLVDNLTDDELHEAVRELCPTEPESDDLAEIRAEFERSRFISPADPVGAVRVLIAHAEGRSDIGAPDGDRERLTDWRSWAGHDGSPDPDDAALRRDIDVGLDALKGLRADLKEERAKAHYLARKLAEKPAGADALFGRISRLTRELDEAKRPLRRQVARRVLNLGLTTLDGLTAWRGES